MYLHSTELLEQVNTELEGERDESKKFCVVHISKKLRYRDRMSTLIPPFVCVQVDTSSK